MTTSFRQRMIRMSGLRPLIPDLGCRTSLISIQVVQIAEQMLQLTTTRNVFFLPFLHFVGETRWNTTYSAWERLTDEYGNAYYYNHVRLLTTVAAHHFVYCSAYRSTNPSTRLKTGHWRVQLGPAVRRTIRDRKPRLHSICRIKYISTQPGRRE